VRRFLVYKFVPRVNRPPTGGEKPIFWGSLKLKSMESVFPYISTTAEDRDLKFGALIESKRS